MDLVKSIHYSPVAGHLGMAKTKAMVQKLGYWLPDLDKIVNKVVGHCHGCQRSKAHRSYKLKADGVQWTSFPQVKWTEVSCDHIGPLTPDEFGFTYLLVVMDHFSKYLIVIPVKSRDEITTARACQKWSKSCSV